MRGHAEIAGAGFAGLTLAGLLAERQWTVTVHERGDEIRAIGAGIYLATNGLRTLADLDLLSELGGARVQRQRLVDQRGRVLVERGLGGSGGTRVVSRQSLIDLLLDRARRAGAEIVTGSRIAAAREGSFVTADGSIRGGDLLVGADGFDSTLRDALGVASEKDHMATVSLRFLIPGREFTTSRVSTEHRSRRRRVSFVECGDVDTYVYMACPASEVDGAATPLDVESRSAHFPRLRHEFEVLHDHHHPYKATYKNVSCRTWSVGSVALIGDAAHAQPPTLGQAANLALTNARSLATFLEVGSSVGAALQDWERAVRPVTDRTQLWAKRYDGLSSNWPRSMSWARPLAIRLLNGLPMLSRGLRLAAETPPITSLRGD
jgi:2-polyprenyl-6-methoxyphenol hydroxylase-like FAD-dependent oxidoreductase